MNLTTSTHLCGRFKKLAPGMAARLRHWLQFVLFASMALLPPRALADDECANAAEHAKALVAALNNAAASNPTAGRFDVRRLGSRDEAGRFQVTYVVGNRPIFSQRLEQQAAVSDHFHASASRKSAAVLELGYAYGAGGRSSCEYAIGRAPVQFVARRTN